MYCMDPEMILDQIYGWIGSKLVSMGKSIKLLSVLNRTSTNVEVKMIM